MTTLIQITMFALAFVVTDKNIETQGEEVRCGVKY